MDLGRGEAGAVVGVHRLEHVADELLDGRCRDDARVDRLGDGAQDGVPELGDLQDGPGASGDAPLLATRGPPNTRGPSASGPGPAVAAGTPPTSGGRARTSAGCGSASFAVAPRVTGVPAPRRDGAERAQSWI